MGVENESSVTLQSPQEIDEDALLEAVGQDAEGQPQTSFRDLLGPDCIIKRVDKNKNVLGPADPEEMQHEMMTRAAAQKRLGACAEYCATLSRADKLAWALETKDRANELYTASHFEEAAKLYNDCLVALDFDGTDEENKLVVDKLQLPICTNLAACMIEMSAYHRCIEICDIALSADKRNAKAAYRRGLAHYRLGNHKAARPDFEFAFKCIEERREKRAAEVTLARPSLSVAAGVGDPKLAAEAAVREDEDLRRRVLIYLSNIRQYCQNERDRCKKMFEAEHHGLYSDRPGRAETAQAAIDDSDAALDEAIQRVRNNRACCPCRSRSDQKDKTS